MTNRDALVERMAWGICEKCYPPKCEYLCGECLRQASAALDIALEEAAKKCDARAAELAALRDEARLGDGEDSWEDYNRRIIEVEKNAAAIRALNSK